MKKTFYILSIVFLLFSCDAHKVTSIEILGDSVRIMNINERITLEAKINPLESYIYNQVYWTSSDESVAVVDLTRGIVTAVYSGVCTITAKVGDHKATCKIRVNTINLDFSFSKAAAYFLGEKNGINNCVLRLLSDGYNLQPDGYMTGAGYFFDIDLWYSTSDIFPPNGNYTPFNEMPTPFSFAMGDTVREDGGLYAVGTYFLQSTLSGNSAILIKDGSFKIQNNTFTGNFIGGKGEKIVIGYSGDATFIDRTLPPPDTLKIDDYITTDYTVLNRFDNGTPCVQYKIFLTTDKYLQIEFVVPISASFIPLGLYRLSGLHQPFSLSESDTENLNGTIFVENSLSAKEILYGSVNVESMESGLKFKIYLVEKSGKVIVGEIFK